jgi:hypothetical protein
VAKRSDASRQKRSRQNRAQREALAARTSGDAVKRPSRVAPATAERLSSTPRESTRAGSQDPTEAPAPGEKGSKKTRERRERAPKPGDRPVDIATLEGSWFSKVVKVPGGMQVLMAAGMTIVITGMLAIMDTYPSQADLDNDVSSPKPSRTIFEALGGGRAALLLAIPLALVGIAAAFALHKQRRRVWLVCAIGLAAVFGMVLPHYVFPMGFLLYAVMRASRIEGPNEPLFGGRSRRRATDEAASEDGEAAEPSAADETSNA